MLVWFPDPSVMRMRGRGKKGLGNNYTLARARGWNLKKVLEYILVRAVIRSAVAEPAQLYYYTRLAAPCVK